MTVQVYWLSAVALIELGRVTDAQCDRPVPSDAGGAESACGRVPDARRHASAPLGTASFALRSPSPAVPANRGPARA